MAATMYMTDTEAVADACLATYRLRAEVVRYDDAAGIPVVICEADRRVEIILADGMEPGSVADVVDDLVHQEWDVWILVPSRELGVAHAALRPRRIVLQPWWTEGGLVHFGKPEIP